MGFGASRGSTKPDAARGGCRRVTPWLPFTLHWCFSSLLGGQRRAAVPRGLPGNQQEPQVQKTEGRRG